MCLEEEGLDDSEGNEGNCAVSVNKSADVLTSLDNSRRCWINVYGKRYAWTEGFDA